MHSVYLNEPGRQSAAAAAPEPVPERQARLQGVALLARKWLERIPALDSHRESVLRMGILADDLAMNGTPSAAAMGALRAMLCANCRRLDAAQGQCSGQIMERCRLLAGRVG